MYTTLPFVTIGLYFIASIVQLFCLFLKLGKRWQYWVVVISAVALIAHGALLHFWIDVAAGQNLTFFNTLSQIIWIAAVFVWLMALRRPMANLGVLIYPLAAISILLVLFFSGSYIINTAAAPKQLLHILLSFFAIGIGVVVALQAIFLALLDHSLRKKYSNALVHSLPSLQKMESILFQLIALGALLLTLVIYTGLSFYTQELQSGLWHHMLLSILAWIIFLVLLFGRWRWGWRGTLAIRWSLMGSATLFFAFLLSQFWNF